MVAQTYLNKGRWLELCIKSKQEQIEKLNSLLYNISPTLSDMPHSPSPNQDKLGTVMAELIDLQTQLNGDIKLYILTIKDIRNTIERLPEPEKLVLEQYFISGKKFEDIAEEMGYSRKQIWRFYKRGLAQVEQELTT